MAQPAKRRPSSLLDAVGSAVGVGGRRATVRASTKAAGIRTAVPVKPPVVKATPSSTVQKSSSSPSLSSSSSSTSSSRIPVTSSTKTLSLRGRTPSSAHVQVPASLTDLSWKFDSRAASPEGPQGDTTTTTPTTTTTTTTSSAANATTTSAAVRLTSSPHSRPRPPPIRPKQSLRKTTAAAAAAAAAVPAAAPPPVSSASPRNNNNNSSSSGGGSSSSGREVIIHSRRRQQQQQDARAVSGAGAPSRVGVGPAGTVINHKPQRTPSTTRSSEEQAIHDLQELVRRQQEELEEYHQETINNNTNNTNTNNNIINNNIHDNNNNNNNNHIHDNNINNNNNIHDNINSEDDTNNTSSWPLSSCALVRQIAKVDKNIVVVEELLAEPYSGPLKVKAVLPAATASIPVRLEDQDLPSDVLQDPRLAATRSRLNQRLQHLLDDGLPGAGASRDDGQLDAANKDADDPEGSGGGDVVGDLLDLELPTGDSTRRDVLLEGLEGLTSPPPAPHRDDDDWEPQPLADTNHCWSAASQLRVDDAANKSMANVDIDMPVWCSQQDAPPAFRYTADSHVDGVDSHWRHRKDQYHREIQQLLETLNADVYPIVHAEPIYATAIKKSQRLAPGGPSPRRDGGAVEEGDAGERDEDRSLRPPLDQKADQKAVITTLGDQQLQRPHRRMSPLSDGDVKVRGGMAPGSDLSLSSDNTSGDDGIGDEQRPPTSRTKARTRGRRDEASAGVTSRDSRDLSMDSGIQGSSCDLDSSASAASSSASDPHDDDPDTLTEALSSRPAPIGDCEFIPSRRLADPLESLEPAGGRGPRGELPDGDVEVEHAVEQAFKVVEELYVADAVSNPPRPDAGTSSARTSQQQQQQQQQQRVFTETHFDSTPSLGPLGSLQLGDDVSSSAPDRVGNPLSAAHGGLNSFPGNSSILSLPNAQQVAVGGAAMASLPHSVSTSNLYGSQGFGQGLLSPPEPFRRSHFREASGHASGLVARQSKRFSSADDVFQASLLRHSLPAKPPRTSSVRTARDRSLDAYLDEGLPKQPYDYTNANISVPECAVDSSLTAAPAYQVVVAIDFGTTYSGYAFCYTKDPDCNIHMMRKWEGGDPGLHNEKAPTALLLTPEAKFHSFGFLARDTFHDLHPDHAKRWLYFDKFKMALLSQTTLTRDTTLAAANGRQVSALTVLSLSLAHLRERALAELAAADQGLPRGDVVGDVHADRAEAAGPSVRWVLTVPALWGPSATQLLREAAHMANLASPDCSEDLLIVLEPEAASLCCRQLRLHQLNTAPQPMASLVLDPQGKGLSTQYMVVDCGGGTVDITVHELSGDRATLRELHKASGGACGSLGVDREFERLLSAVFGADFISHFRRKRPAAYVELLLSFEARKRSVDPERESILTIFPPFAFVEAYRKFRGKEVEHAVRKFGHPGEISWSSQGMLRLSPPLMADLFRPTLDQVCQQVEEVLRSPRNGNTGNKAIEFLFLVGGFAQSLMLQHRVRSQFGSRVKVVVPQAVGLTTLRGAVLYGLDPSLVAQRRSKHTIGVGVLKRFQPGEHPQDKLVTLSDGSAWCCDVLDVLVVADQALGPGEAVNRSYTPASAKQTNIIIHIYCSSDTTPPKFVTDVGVTRCGTLRLTLDPESAGHRGSRPGGADHPVDAASAKTRKREIVARIEFGGTEMAASAQDVATGRCVRTQLDFLSTAV